MSVQGGLSSVEDGFELVKCGTDGRDELSFVASGQGDYLDADTLGDPQKSLIPKDTLGGPNRVKCGTVLCFELGNPGKHRTDRELTSANTFAERVGNVNMLGHSQRLSENMVYLK